MKCPKCSDSTMHDFHHQGVDFNICSPGCRGIWCDKGEVAYYTETFKDTPLKHDLHGSGTETEFKCPVCTNVHLKEFRYQEGHDLLIDICPKCEGIYLDCHELAEVEKIAQTLDKEGKLMRTIHELANFVKDKK